MMDKIIFNGLTPKGKIFLQIFLRFLKENDYFYNYKKAFENYKSDSKFERFTLNCNCLSPNIIGNTLYWSGTDEGFGYWAHVNAQFQILWYFIRKKITLS